MQNRKHAKRRRGDLGLLSASRSKICREQKNKLLEENQKTESTCLFVFIPIKHLQNGERSPNLLRPFPPPHWDPSLTSQKRGRGGSRSPQNQPARSRGRWRRRRRTPTFTSEQIHSEEISQEREKSPQTAPAKSLWRSPRAPNWGKNKEQTTCGERAAERERKVGLPHGRRRFAGRKRRSLVTTRGQNSGAEESIEYSHLVGGGSIWGSHLVCISFWKESGMFLSAMAAHVPPLNVTGRSRVGRLGGRMRFLSPWEIDPSPPSGLRGVRSSALKSATQVGELTTRALR